MKLSPEFTTNVIVGGSEQKNKKFSHQGLEKLAFLGEFDEAAIRVSLDPTDMTIRNIVK